MRCEAGIKLGTPSRATFAGRVHELAGGDAKVIAMVEPLLAVREGSPVWAWTRYSDRLSKKARDGFLTSPSGRATWSKPSNINSKGSKSSSFNFFQRVAGRKTSIKGSLYF